MENLGEVAPWQIKEFPVEIREELTKVAKARSQTVGAFLTDILVEYRDAGWPERAVVTLSNSTANFVKPPDPDRLHQAIASLAMLAQHEADIPPPAWRAAHRLLGREMRALANRVPRRTVQVLPARSPAGQWVAARKDDPLSPGGKADG